MRKSRLLLTCLVLGVLSVPAWADEFSVAGSYWNTGDFDNGVGGSLRWAPQIGDSPWDLEFRGTYYNDLAHEEDDNAPDFEVHAIPVELGATYNFTKDKPADVYLGGGGGYYFLDTNEGQLDDELGYWAATGVKFGKPKGASFFIEGNYRWMEATVEGVSAPGDPNVDQNVDLDLNGFGANAGVVWKW